MIVRYVAEYWDGDSPCKPSKEGGIVCANNTIGEAVDKVYDYYSKENMVSIQVYECEDIMADYEIKEMIT